MELISFFAKETSFYLIAGLIIFLGLGLFLYRKNLLIGVLALEVIYNGVNLLFVTTSHYYGDPKGKLIALTTLAVAAGSFAIGLILVINYYKVKKTLSLESMKSLGEEDVS